MSAGQNVGPLDREARRLFQPPLPPDEATWALAAAAGISTVGLRPSFVIPAAAHSHPDCRAVLILIVAPQAYAGLAPSPWQSGGVERDQGISKSGNRRLRHTMIELAWFWLRHQPDSALSRWFQARVGAGKGRVRRIAIVALARKLLVALWRYVTQGVVPEGAVFKTA